MKENFLNNLASETEEGTEALVHQYFGELKEQCIREAIIKQQLRLDNRRPDEIRPINIRTDYLPSAHGSALFTRGETQSLTTVTLGGKRDEQMIDGATREGFNRFMLHYNFPPFSTGEAKMMRGTSRREVGHGNLAMRTVKQVLPTEDECPFTIRIVSDILQSNGSSSMATVCAASLALMDAGIPVKKAVAGIAMGLIKEGDQFEILSDILGDEDHVGDMDFKVAGTADGTTACQMDIKVDGLPFEIVLKALHQAKKGREHILAKMNQALSAPSSAQKAHAPKIERVRIPKKFIGAVIGSGGKLIQELQASTGTVINIEEDGDFGKVEISGRDADGIARARKQIDLLITEPKPGDEYEGVVKSILPFGVFVEILPGKDGLLHISDFATGHIEDLRDHISEGDTLKVKIAHIDTRNGKIKLQRTQTGDVTNN
ncbi:MAG: polyribonucleotide nucleotidyltransferase [Owenweeksia sp.]|nr:polyribonucleotide nucleotidyltransferase [Owenweeksia sp.]